MVSPFSYSFFRGHLEEWWGELCMLRVPLGQLRLELGKEAYERSGLAGKAISDGGRKHVKSRFGMSVMG